MFKVGDKVKKKNGFSFVNGEIYCTVREVIDKRVWFEEYDNCMHCDNLELVEPFPLEYDINKILAKEDRPDSDHYHTGGIDVWQFAEANFDYDELFGFHKINAIKYLTRFGKKNGRNIRDLEKAQAVIAEMIRMEKGE